MEIVKPQRRGDVDSSRLCVCGAASPTMTDSQSSVSGFPADEMAQIAMIPRFFDFTRNVPQRWTDASNAKTACLALLSEPTACRAKPSFRGAADRQPAETEGIRK